MNPGFIAAAGTAAIALATLAGGATAATVDCPNGAVTDRYVRVTNAQAGGLCYYQDGNLQVADYPSITPGTPDVTEIDKNGSSGGLFTGPVGGSTSGNWSLDGSLWTAWANLYIGFHFGGGQGLRDSFVVQLQNGATSGTWAFLAIAPTQVNGLSNYHLFGMGTPGGGGGGGGGGNTPEPMSLALVAAALLAARAAARRRG